MALLSLLVDILPQVVWFTRFVILLAGRTGSKPSSSSSASSSGFLPVTATAGALDVAITANTASNAEAVAQRNPPKVGLFPTSTQEKARPAKENSGGDGGRGGRSRGAGGAGGGGGSPERSVQFAAGGTGLAAVGAGAAGKDEELRSAHPVTTMVSHRNGVKWTNIVVLFDPFAHQNPKRFRGKPRAVNRGKQADKFRMWHLRKRVLRVTKPERTSKLLGRRQPGKL